MGDRFWNRQIRQIEKAGNDDFVLILTGGAKAYATHELHHLLRRLRIEGLQLRRLRNATFTLGLGISALFFAACAAGLLGWQPLVYLSLAAIGTLILMFVAALIYARNHFSYHDRSKRLRCIIQQELERRRKDVDAYGI